MQSCGNLPELMRYQLFQRRIRIRQAHEIYQFQPIQRKRIKNHAVIRFDTDLLSRNDRSLSFTEIAVVKSVDRISKYA